MKHSLSRGALLVGGVQLLLGLTAPAADEQKSGQPAAAGIAELERDLQGRIGVAVLDTANNRSIAYSDNTAANLLLQTIGGPHGLTEFVRSLGDPITRLDHNEPELNAAIKGDEHDTTTPAAMLNDVKSLLLGETLSAAGRQRLGDWLIKNTTGDKRLRAGLPSTWQVGDKTGTGDNGATGDVAMARPPNRAPILIVVYTVESVAPSEKINEAFAAIGKIVGEEF